MPFLHRVVEPSSLNHFFEISLGHGVFFFPWTDNDFLLMAHKCQRKHMVCCHRHLCETETLNARGGYHSKVGLSGPRSMCLLDFFHLEGGVDSTACTTTISFSVMVYSKLVSPTFVDWSGCLLGWKFSVSSSCPVLLACPSWSP